MRRVSRYYCVVQPNNITLVVVFVDHYRISSNPKLGITNPRVLSSHEVKEVRVELQSLNLCGISGYAFYVTLWIHYNASINLLMHATTYLHFHARTRISHNTRALQLCYIQLSGIIPLFPRYEHTRGEHTRGEHTMGVPRASTHWWPAQSYPAVIRIVLSSPCSRHGKHSAQRRRNRCVMYSLWPSVLRVHALHLIYGISAGR